MTIEGVCDPLLETKGPIQAPVWQYVIVHHSGAEEKDTEQIRRYHKSLGWRDIGYHFVIERDGKVVTGRSISLPGAHCKDNQMNFRGIGVCMVGNMNDRAPTPKQYKSLVEHLVSLCKEHHIPVGNVLGHKEAPSATACPGKHTNMAQIRKDVGQKRKASKSSFRDIPGDHWALDDIQYLWELNLVRGDKQGFLRPNDVATRAEMFAFGARVLEYMNKRIKEVLE